MGFNNMFLLCLNKKENSCSKLTKFETNKKFKPKMIREIVFQLVKE